VLRLILGTGLRRGEALALRWADLDLGRGEARVTGSLVRLEGTLVVAETKTARSRRVVSLSHCRQLAYAERLEERFDRDPVEAPQPVPGSVLDRWVTEGTKFDEIVQEPYLLSRFLDDLMCRIAVDHILEDHRYQNAVNQLIVTFFMIGRMSDGTFQLPIVV
jgi:hypothetical protein